MIVAVGRQGGIAPSTRTANILIFTDRAAGDEHGYSGRLSGSPFVEDASVSGSHYAGEQPGINDRNTASVSQYDIACFPGPDRPQ